MPEVLGLDIGGANLKAATSSGESVTLPFPLWKQPEKLAGGLKAIQDKLPDVDSVAITMTGELCDCFENKAAGVRHILGAVGEVFREQPVFVWRNDARWASVQHGLDDPLPIAAANWLASATFASRYLPQSTGWFLDLGSTTLDMIPLLDGRVVTKSRTDLDRLKAGELAYLGASRTPISSLVQYVEVDQATLSVAAEWFATLDDVRLVLEHLDEDHRDTNSADGKPRTREYAYARLARLVCADVVELGKPSIKDICQQVMSAYRRKLRSHLRFSHARQSEQLTHRWGGVVLAGSGEEYLAREIAFIDSNTSPVVSMTGRVGPELSTALAAYSVAMLLAERQSR